MVAGGSGDVRPEDLGLYRFQREDLNPQPRTHAPARSAGVSRICTDWLKKFRENPCQSVAKNLRPCCNPAQNGRARFS